jgi:hypothetical protein
MLTVRIDIAITTRKLESPQPKYKVQVWPRPETRLPSNEAPNAHTPEPNPVPMRGIIEITRKKQNLQDIEYTLGPE